MNLFRYIFIIFWSILSITSSLVLMVLLFNKKLPLRMARGFWSPGILWAAGIKLKVYGAENIDPDKTYVFVSNHQSYLDIPALFRGLPVNIYFVGKQELKKVPFIGWYMQAVGMIFIDRNAPRKAVSSIKDAGKMVDLGKNIIIFPEGTRSKDGALGKFKKGTFLLLANSDVPVIPISIKGTGKVWPSDSFKLTPGIVEVHIGKEIKTGAENSRELIGLMDNVKEKMLELSV